MCGGGGASDITSVYMCLSVCRATRSQLSPEKENVCHQIVKSKASMHFIHMQYSKQTIQCGVPQKQEKETQIITILYRMYLF